MTIRSRLALALVCAGGAVAVLGAFAGVALAHSGQSLQPPAEQLSFWAVGAEFAPYGAKHILLGYDHLLFLAGLALLCSGVRDVLWIAAMFALAYSATLVGATLMGIAVPGDLVDAVIAISVAYVGVQIAFGSGDGWPSRDPRPPALAFGLAHGLGLSSLLQDLQLPGDDVLPSVIGFNVGVELGQLAVIGVVVGLLSAARAFPIPVRERIPAGVAFVFAGAVFLSAVTLGAPAAFAHPAKPPPPPAAPAPDVEPIPAEDEDQYVSHVTAVRPRVPGLEARIVGNQDKLEVTWTGDSPLVVDGVEGEPMLRMSSRGIEINERSPSAYLSSDRYAEVSMPGQADADAPPRWRRIEDPGPISWYEHRAQWMRAERPGVVGDGADGTTVFHWSIPARLGGQELAIRGSLDWLPDPAAIRAERSEVSSPLLSALILAVAMGLGALTGVAIRSRLEPDPQPE
jgi:hypothetical protein